MDEDIDLDFIIFTKKDQNQVFVPVYKGRACDIISRLIETNQTQISVKGIMEQRLNALNSNNIELTKQWYGPNSFNTGDGIIYHPDGRIKIVANSPTLISTHKIPPELRKIEVATPKLESGTFNKTQGYEFSRKDVEKYANCNSLSKTQVIENPIWIALAQEDRNLLKEYVEQVTNLEFERLKKSETLESKSLLRENFDRFWDLYIDDWRETYYSETEKIIRFNIDSISADYADEPSARLVAIPHKKGPLYVLNKQTSFNLERFLRDFSKLANKNLLNPKVQTLYENLLSGKYNSSSNF